MLLLRSCRLTIQFEFVIVYTENEIIIRLERLLSFQSTHNAHRLLASLKHSATKMVQIVYTWNITQSVDEAIDSDCSSSGYKLKRSAKLSVTVSDCKCQKYRSVTLHIEMKREPWHANTFADCAWTLLALAAGRYIFIRWTKYFI